MAARVPGASWRNRSCAESWIDECPVAWPDGFLPGFGLRSASGEVERRRREASSESEPERNAAAEPQTEACGTCGMCGCSLVTSARFAKWNGRGREGDGADRQPVERSESRAGHGGFTPGSWLVFGVRGLGGNLRMLGAFPPREWPVGLDRLWRRCATSGFNRHSALCTKAHWLSSASVCGRRAGKWSGGRREADSESEPERNVRRRAANGSPPPMRRPDECRS